MATTQYYGTGRRKRAIACVRLVPGEGKMVVNKQDIKDYFGGRFLTFGPIIKQPLIATSTIDKYDVLVKVEGGGVTGQAGAIRHGIARALLEVNAELRAILKRNGFLTRDPREHERKKYGLYGRRRRFQFSKR
ncbi:MAG: 30S ribosomal protein S9 [bacterium]|nr:30S ribosomal protein S9 [bacterium]